MKIEKKYREIDKKDELNRIIGGYIGKGGNILDLRDKIHDLYTTKKGIIDRAFINENGEDYKLSITNNHLEFKVIGQVISPMLLSKGELNEFIDVLKEFEAVLTDK